MDTFESLKLYFLEISKNVDALKEVTRLQGKMAADITRQCQQLGEIIERLEASEQPTLPLGGLN